MNEIELGDKVKDIYSGFTGTAISRTEFINGCIQIGVVAKMAKGKEMPVEMDFDEGSLEIVSKKKEPREKKDTGGPNRIRLRRNY